jgi:hypothetical protein
LDCLAAVAAGEEMLPPDSGTPAHRGAADPHGLHQQVRHLWHSVCMCWCWSAMWCCYELHRSAAVPLALCVVSSCSALRLLQCILHPHQTVHSTFAWAVPPAARRSC